MLNNLQRQRIIWRVLACAALFCATIGVIRVEIYEGVVENKIIPGAYGQDWITICTAIILLYIAFKTREANIYFEVIAFGILGYLFYAYGLYSIEQTYNALYLIYLFFLRVHSGHCYTVLIQSIEQRSRQLRYLRELKYFLLA